MDLSIIIPVYNSEKILPVLIEEIKKSLMANKLKKELIFVNDLSEDHSWEKIKNKKKFIYKRY